LCSSVALVGLAGYAHKVWILARSGFCRSGSREAPEISCKCLIIKNKIEGKLVIRAVIF
jgi:hypothetical protein